ncbi:MAG: ATP-binding protein [Myxococcota bacterium]|nr:ATP-binding protein [Myxococcota bacterium]
MIARAGHLDKTRRLLRQFPVVGILGPRQVGKTTLARAVAERAAAPRSTDRVHWFDLESPRDEARLADPFLALERLRGLVVIDEVQRRPELFPTLRVLADRPRTPARFLVLGSAAPSLLRQTSETLAGRVAFHEVGGFTMDEVGPTHMERLWVRGAFPRSFLARSEPASFEWRDQLARTFLEREVAELELGIPPVALRRFWSMLAHHHAQLWNASELGRAFGVADTTVRRYLDVLTGTFMVRQLTPFFENVGKRQVKSPKVYLADSGMLHAILGIRTRDELDRHPKIGASWEGFALMEIVARLGVDARECFFWATHAGAELDLLVVRGSRRLGFEIKRTDSPRVTPSMRSAIDALRLDSLDVVHAGTETYPLADGIRALSLARLAHDVRPLRP